MAIPGSNPSIDVSSITRERKITESLYAISSPREDIANFYELQVDLRIYPRIQWPQRLNKPKHTKKGGPVSFRLFASIVVLMTWISLASSPITLTGQGRPSSRSTSTKAWIARKAPTGDPDLQGVWTTTTTTPFERPPQYGNRLYLTDQEFAEAERDLERQREADLRETVSPNASANTGPPAHWTERPSRASRQTSLVVEPADGRVPVQAWAEAKRDYDIAHNTESWEYMSPWDRCITRGMPGGMFPG